jgi:hypothetical protein
MEAIGTQPKYIRHWVRDVGARRVERATSAGAGLPVPTQTSATASAVTFKLAANNGMATSFRPDASLRRSLDVKIRDERRAPAIARTYEIAPDARFT